MRVMTDKTQTDMALHLSERTENVTKGTPVSTDRRMDQNVKGKLTVEEIGDHADWEVLREPWAQFLKDSGNCDPFLSYEWFDCCLRSFQEKKTLFVLLVKEDSTILGIAPLWRSKDRIRSIPMRKVGFISCPDTPYADFIVSDHRREEVLKAIFTHLFVMKKQEWDVVTLRQWPSNSKNYLAIQDCLSQYSERTTTETASFTPFIELKGDWNSFLLSRSARYRKTRRNIVNKIAKLDHVEIQCVRMDSQGKEFREVVGITERSWKFQEGVAIASTEPMKKFFKELTKIAGERGWLLLWVLRINGAPVGMEYDIVGERTVHALRADFDEAYSEFSPGTYLETEILQRLFQDDEYDVYYTGPGVNSYKLHATENTIENVVINIFNSNVKGKMAFVVENHIVPLLRSCRARVSQKEKE